MKQALSLIALVAAFPAFAEETRQLDSHEHGVGTLNIAIDGPNVAMEFQAPGADIVGFEHAAESATDHSAIDVAVATLDAPLDLFVIPDGAGCSVTKAHAELEGDGGHDEHGEAHHDDHAHEAHQDHEDEVHADEAGHTEFHAEYTLECKNTDALTKITFGFFDVFLNAQAVDVQLITASGSQAFEVKRDAPFLDLER